jgi:hypothetical protein
VCHCDPTADVLTVAVAATTVPVPADDAADTPTVAAAVPADEMPDQEKVKAMMFSVGADMRWPTKENKTEMEWLD